MDGNAWPHQGAFVEDYLDGPGFKRIIHVTPSTYMNYINPVYDYLDKYDTVLNDPIWSLHEAENGFTTHLVITFHFGEKNLTGTM